MLTMMRNMLRSKFAGLLFLLIIISMAVWGTTDIFAPRTGGTIITAGDRALTMADLDEALENYLFAQRNEGGTILTREQAAESGVVDQLVAQEAFRTNLLGYAEEIGAVATEETVVDLIQSIEDFTNPDTGAFDINLYRGRLRQMNRSERQQERLLQDDLTLRYVLGASTAGVQPPALLSRIRAIQLAESRSVAWFTVDASDAGAIAPPSDEALAAYYEENQAAFLVPELRQADIVSLSPIDFVHRVDIPEEDLRAVYEATKAQRFSAPERRTFTEAVAETEAEARQLFGKLAGGAQLSESTDPELFSLRERSALRSDVVIDDLAEGLFAITAREGSVIGPVQRDGLWIVARVNAIIPGEPFAFDTVRETILEEVAQVEAEGLYFDATNQIQTLIGAGLSLSEIAAELGVPIIRRLPVSQSGRTQTGMPFLGLTNVPELVTEIFNTPEGFVTNPVEGDDNTTYLAEVTAITDANTPALDEIRDEVEASFQAEATRTAVQDLADGLIERIESGETDFATAADALGLTVNRPVQSISRANFDVGLPRSTLPAVFSAVEGDVVSAPGPAPGQVTLVKIETITPPTDEEISVLSASERPQLTTSIQTDLRAALDSQIRQSIDFNANASAVEAYKAGILSAP